MAIDPLWLEFNCETLTGFRAGEVTVNQARAAMGFPAIPEGEVYLKPRPSVLAEALEKWVREGSDVVDS